MFDDLKEKIDDFISSIRSKLPGSKSDDDDDEEYEDEEGEFDEKTEEIDVKEKLQESDDEEDDDEFEDDEDDEEDDAKAKKQKFMRLGLVGVVLILGASILLEDGEDENVVPDVKPIVRKNRPKRKKKVVAPKVVEEKKVEKESTPAEPKVAEIPAPVEEKQETVVIENELKLVDDAPEAGPDTVDPLGKEGFENAPNVQTADSSASLGEDNSVENSQTNVNDGDEMSEVIDNLTNDEPPAMIEKVVNEKLEYQEPPSYQDTGRGLVYNCSGKHWACVDQTSYLNCKKNNDWSKENDKDPECYPSNVYRSFKDCRTIQIHNINTVTETDFCKK